LWRREKEIGRKEREISGKGNGDGDDVRLLDPMMALLIPLDRLELELVPNSLALN
jgi:hypothetical protein